VRVQLEPAFIVLSMLVPPTAVQEVVLMQLMLDRVVAPAPPPAGAPRSDQLVPPLVVLTTWAPTAKHVVSLGQAIPSSAPVYPGTACGAHVWPPFVVARMEAPGPGDAEPIAVQSDASAQAMAVKLLTVLGVSSTVHAPPFVVPMMLGEFLPEAKSLTA
jgi:hypothetical protein